MSDLIDRQAAMDCFHDWIDKHGDVHTADEMSEYRAIEALPTADTVRWIPVTERLPDEDCCTGRGIQFSNWVLATIVNHEDDNDYFVDMLCTIDGKWKLTRDKYGDSLPPWCEVIAWMPLPEPF